MKFSFRSRNSGSVTNYMGAEAYRLAPSMELYSAVATCLVDDSYYEKEADRLNRIRALIAACDPVFVAKLAVYARTEMNLRSIPVVLVVELAKNHRGDDLVSRAVAGVVQRADEIREVLAYYGLANGRDGIKKLARLSKQVQKGLATAFNRFDEYQFAKYNSKSSVSLRDALFLVHPKAADNAQQELFDKIAKATLAVPYTWETELSLFGQQSRQCGEDRNAALQLKWQELVESGRLGYMAVLRNLRNIVLKGNEAAVNGALDMVTDAGRIRKARQLPFRYLSAFEELRKTGEQAGSDGTIRSRVEKAKAALEEALIIACNNIRVAPGRTAILSDNSGSMYGDSGGKSLLSAMSSRKSADIANLFAVLYRSRAKDAYIGLFGDRLIEPDWKESDTVFGNFRRISEAARRCGLSTERGIFDYMTRLVETKSLVDRIIVFSDCQVGAGCSWYDNTGNRGVNFNALLEQYRQINPAVKVYSIDLRGYGNTMVRDGAVLVSGWSEKIFDMIYAIEAGSSVEEQINAIVL